MGGPEKPPVTVHGGSTGSSTTSGYSVDYAAASGAVNQAETAVGELPGVATSITNAFTTAEGALPPEFETAKSLLKTHREEHVTAVNTVKTYSTGCITAARSCLNAYENATAEQVAESARYQSKIDYDHPGLFGQTEKAINERGEKVVKPLNDVMPKSEQTKVYGGSYEHTTHAGPGGSTVTHETSSTRNGLTHTNTTTDYARSGPGYSQYGTSTQHTVSHGGASRSTIDGDFTSRTGSSEVRVQTHTDVPPVGEHRSTSTVTRRPIP